MKNFAKLAVAVSLFALGTSAAEAAPIIYSVSASPGAFGAISGTVTTDGTIGNITGANFTAWNIIISGRDALGHTITENLTNLNSSVFSGSTFSGGIVGTLNALVASPTQLTFNYSNATPGFLLFQKVFGSGTSYACFATPGTNLCTSGSSLVPTNTDADGTFAGQGSSSAPAETGVRVIGSAVPEPSTWLTMFAGLGLVGMAMRRKPATVRARIAFAK
jgi:PEP-CTERM motif